MLEIGRYAVGYAGLDFHELLVQTVELGELFVLLCAQRRMFLMHSFAHDRYHHFLRDDLLTANAALEQLVVVNPLRPFAATMLFFATEVIPHLFLVQLPVVRVPRLEVPCQRV